MTAVQVYNTAPKVVIYKLSLNVRTEEDAKR